MAPTICSDKKQMRVTGFKEGRRHHGVISMNSASTSSSSSSSSSPSSPITSARAAANRALQASSVLRHVAKGSMNPSGRRRFAPMPRKMPQISFKDYDDTSSDYTSISAIQETLSTDRENNNCNSNKSFDYDDSLMDEYVDDSDSGYDVTPGPRSMVKRFQEHQQPNFQPQMEQPHNAEGLLSIAIKTIKLVQRNRLLQKRLAQLQLETSEFIASVLANPENSHFHHSKAEAKLSNMLLRH
ncbi:uncharacterized protein Dwil_GK14466 [Drosophila willistoni]|uniref:Uncharacterized protein n=1 Tax=Drosophila willistoni TaxID=7260 RepID=B4NK47_DROWI|nr:uncharacterized protein Dwil_GK14466 [Drosophila willistoni]